MAIPRKLIGVAVGLGYGLVYAYLALLSTGGGHCNFVWSFVFFIPLIGPLIFFPIMGYLVVDLRAKRAKFIYGVLLFCHYVLFLSLIFLGPGWLAEDNSLTWNKCRENFYIMGAVYLIGQIPLLGVLIYSLKNSEESEVSSHLPLK